MNLLDAVVKSVAESGPDLQERLIVALKEKELAGRLATLVEAMGKVEHLRTAIRRVKADEVQYDIDGNKLVEAYSKAKVDERKKLVEQLERMDKLVSKCLTEQPDFGALKKASDAVQLKPGGKTEVDAEPAE